MKRVILAAAAVLAPSAAAVAHAQETQTYSYDVHGRLTSVARTMGGTTRTTVYVLDDADNRTSRATTVASSLAAPSESAPAPAVSSPASTEPEPAPSASSQPPQSASDTANAPEAAR